MPLRPVMHAEMLSRSLIKTQIQAHHQMQAFDMSLLQPTKEGALAASHVVACAALAQSWENQRRKQPSGSQQQDAAKCISRLWAAATAITLEQLSTKLACKINEVQAAVRPDACHMAEPIHNDSQHTVGPTAALVHLGLGHGPVTLPNLHDIQDVLCAGHSDLQRDHVRAIDHVLTHSRALHDAVTLHQGCRRCIELQMTVLIAFIAA